MPPTFGGKSLVTRRWVTRVALVVGSFWSAGRLVVLVSGRAGRDCAAPTRSSRPNSRAAHCACSTIISSSTDSQRRSARSVAGSVSVTHVAQGHRARSGVGSGDRDRRCTTGRGRPSAPRRRASRMLEEIHPGLAVGSGRWWGVPPVGDPVDRADLLALVAAVDPVPQGPPVLLGERSRRLHQPGQAPTGIEHPRRHQCSGGAGGQATGAAPATLAREGRAPRGRWAGAGRR